MNEKKNVYLSLSISLFSMFGCTVGIFLGLLHNNILLYFTISFIVSYLIGTAIGLYLYKTYDQ